MTLSLDHLRRLVVITGISGAGKSTALQNMSDLGFYVIDNLPIPLFRSFVDFTRQRPNKYALTSLILDTDSSSKVRELIGLLDATKGEALRLVFLDADNEVLLKRYSETRRPHPEYNAARDASLEDTIQRERDRLEPIRYRSHVRLDTTSSTVHDLRRELKTFVDSLDIGATSGVRVNFISFGFKYGVPRDCDLVMDIRFLPNPHFVPALRPKVGLDPAVSAYVLDTPDAQEFVTRYVDLLSFLLPRYAHEGKAYLNIGIGCTGGRHRSVAIAEEMKRRVSTEGFVFSVKHRDINR